MFAEENQDYVPVLLSGISRHLPRYTYRRTSTDPNKQIQLSRRQSPQQQQIRYGTRYTNVGCFQGLWRAKKMKLAEQRCLHKNIMCSVACHSSLNPLIRCRNLNSVQSGFLKIPRLYDASLVHNTKCQVVAAYPKWIYPGKI